MEEVLLVVVVVLEVGDDELGKFRQRAEEAGLRRVGVSSTVALVEGRCWRGQMMLVFDLAASKLARRKVVRDTEMPFA